MAIIGVYEARTRFSELLDCVARRERFAIKERRIKDLYSLILNEIKQNFALR